MVRLGADSPRGGLAFGDIEQLLGDLADARLERLHGARGEARLDQFAQAGVVGRVDGEQVAPERQKLSVGFRRLLELCPLFGGHGLQPVHREAVVQQRSRSLVVVGD
jgi:hypothetical protein